MTQRTLRQEQFLQIIHTHIQKNTIQQLTLQIEKRNPRWMYGIHNHAEFLGYTNPHDKCLWDALIPGYKKKFTPDKKYKVKDIIGIYLLENGNHKTVCKIYKPGYNAKKASRDVKNYMKRYYQIHGLRHKWVQLAPY